jgi:predicted small secreted protein
VSATIIEKEGPSLMRKVIVLAAAAAALMVSACNTVAGVGRDVQAAGRAVTGTANDAKH